VPAIETDLLEAGSRSASDVAHELAAFIAAAQRSVDVAIYDFQARTGATTEVARALEAAATRGVAVRVAFNLDRDPHAAAPPPPVCNPQEIDGLNVPTRGVHGDGSLMHHKYVIRDGRWVWTGSLNWTDDAFALEENVILRIDSEGIAGAFASDFEQLWDRGDVEKSGGSGEEVQVEDARVRAFFSPRGPSLGHVAAERLGQARHHVRILTPVLTAGPILGTLAEMAGRRTFDISGAYDRTQMEEVQAQWARVPANHWKIEAWAVIAPRLSGKRSTPYREGSVHDYMHAKAIVADGTVLAGSYNFSKHGEGNAENLVMIESGVLSQRFSQFAEAVAARYAVSLR